MKFHGQIEYTNSEGTEIHSDICFDCDEEGAGEDSVPEETRAIYHQSLDEWLDKSNGTGRFILYQIGGTCPECHL